MPFISGVPDVESRLGSQFDKTKSPVTSPLTTPPHIRTLTKKMKLLYFSPLAQAALAATVTYNWDITWVNANPDGAFERPVIGMLL
jgi:hypothetical protein